MAQQWAAWPMFDNGKRTVFALKIGEIRRNGDAADIVPADPSFLPFPVSARFVESQKPVAGGFITAKDGRQKFVPAEKFVADYSPV